MLYLLRVGVDKTYGNFWSPVFKDLTYIFIPIPQKKKKLDPENAQTYKDYKWQGRSIVNYLPKLPKKIKFNKETFEEAPEQVYIHNDPEFSTFTYGTPEFNGKNGRIEKNYNAFLKLAQEDVLCFYAAFKGEKASLDGYYLFAYFVVDKVITYDDPSKLSLNTRRLIAKNHHFLHGFEKQLVVVGKRRKSKVLKRLVPLSLKNKNLKGSNYYPCTDIKKILKYNASLNRSSLRQFDDLDIQKEFLKYLKAAGGVEGKKG